MDENGLSEEFPPGSRQSSAREKSEFVCLYVMRKAERGLVLAQGSELVLNVNRRRRSAQKGNP